MVIAQATAAYIELAKGKSLRGRLDSHGHRMSSDAKEILWALVFAPEDATKELVETASRG
ncbi:hypothetical protein [Novosphingobium sp. P6W]|uniref:hypothetical protein n=1 Tax=Novosphingobium sp. P6W TaxID=1609758 RepID=UPI0005C31D4E|nr:hypothetical protein [Novosphingobium sp. P6W]AXB79128.1 hypothetical protein TQ38_021565 [Novosphingobium sp. P6W]KIS30405.1 hypothetical protein TQ38_22515 [Novosphingobium sp. P6W]